MEDCKYTTQDIGRYLLNKMNSEEETGFQFHLSQCEICRTKLTEMRCLAKSLTEISSPLRIKRKKGKIKALYPYKAGAAVAALFLIGYFLFFTFRKENNTIYPGLQPNQFHQTDTIKTDSASVCRDTLFKK